MYLYGYSGYGLFVDVAVNNLRGSILLLGILAGGVSAREAVLTFNEIHYHPSAAHDSGEWVELYNQMAVPVDISGWKLSAGIDFDFPEGTVVEPGAYLVVAREPAKLQAQTGYADALGPYTGSLSNGGETIRLRNNKGSFRTRVDTRLVVPEDQLWSVDFQGDSNNGSNGQTPPVLMSGVEANAGFGRVWNGFTIAGHNMTSTDPALNLVDSGGNTSAVSMALAGTVSGWSLPGSALLNDYLFVNAGNADADVDWVISGLQPGTDYTLYAYGGISRNINLLIDQDGDGSLADDSNVLVPGAGKLIRRIRASASGEMIGRALPGTNTEGNWGGFQLLVDPGPPNHEIWSVDLQGDGNGGAFGQLTPPNLMSGLEPAANLGGVWNAFTVAGHANTTTDPSLVLVDSAGATSTVTFAMDGTVTGFSNPGSALVGDYVFVHAGNSDPDVDWTLSGLLPGTNYAIFAYGSAIRDIRLLIDRNGDGSLADDSDVVVNAAGRWITPITASPGGAIMGRALPGTVSE